MRKLAITAVVVGLVLLTGLLSAGWTTSLLEDQLYDDDVVYAGGQDCSSGCQGVVYRIFG